MAEAADQGPEIRDFVLQDQAFFLASGWDHRSNFGDPQKLPIDVVHEDLIHTYIRMLKPEPAISDQRRFPSIPASICALTKGTIALEIMLKLCSSTGSFFWDLWGKTSFF